MPKPMTMSDPETVANPKLETRQRRRFTMADRKRIVDEAQACTKRGELSALLRREKIYSSQLNSWRKSLEAQGERGLENKKVGRKPIMDSKDREIQKLKDQNSRLSRQLQIKNDLLELQKKVISILDQLELESKP